MFIHGHSKRSPRKIPTKNPGTTSLAEVSWQDLCTRSPWLFKWGPRHKSGLTRPAARVPRAISQWSLPHREWFDVHRVTSPMRAIWPAQSDGGWRSTSNFSAENCTHQKSNTEHEENAWLLRSQHFFDVFDMLCRLGWTNPRLSKLWTCHTKRISDVMTIYHTKNDGSFSKRDFWILRNMGNIVHVHHIFHLPRKKGIRMGARLKPTAAKDSNTQKLHLPRGWDSIRFPAFFYAERRSRF